MDSIKHLVVNPEIYTPVFITTDNMHFDLIKKCIYSTIPKSKTKAIYHNLEDIMLVYKDYYKEVIDHTKLFLEQNNIENEVFWYNANGVIFPCGYEQVAVAESSLERIDRKEQKTPIEIKEYCNKISEFMNTPIFIQYDYFTNSYGIGLKGNNFEKLLLKFNTFVSEYGMGPFAKISEVSCYGEVNGNTYPRLAKRR